MVWDSASLQEPPEPVVNTAATGCAAARLGAGA
jgi:hypothetical protein